MILMNNILSLEENLITSQVPLVCQGYKYDATKWFISFVHYSKWKKEETVFETI